MKKLDKARSLALGLAALAATSLPGFAANTPIPFFSGSGGANPIGLPGILPDMNNLIQKINAILTPLQPNIPNGVNFISLSGGQTGQGATIGIQPGGDANAAIKIMPAGNGNIVLFPSDTTSINSTGVIKVGNTASWRPIQGMGACPGVVPNSPPIGMSDHIRGYLITKDWLDRSYGLPGC